MDGIDGVAGLQAFVAGLAWLVIGSSAYFPSRTRAFRPATVSPGRIVGGRLKTYLQRACMVTVSTYAALFVVNLFVHGVSPAHFAPLLTKPRGVAFDTRDRAEVIQDLRKQGIAAVPMVNPGLVVDGQGDPSWVRNARARLFPLSGISSALTVYCNENGYFSQYRGDQYGFNNPPETEQDRPYDVLIIGDSFAQGACVNPEDDAAGNLRKQGFKVVSLGMGGDGPLLELSTLMEYGRAYQAHTILWLYSEANDLSYLESELKVPVLRRYLEGQFSQDLIHRQREIDDFWKTYIAHEEAVREGERTARRRTASLLALRDLRVLKGRSSASRKIAAALKDKPLEDAMTALEVESGRYLPVFRQVIGRAYREAKTLGARLYFVYLPSYERYAYKARSYHDEVLAHVRNARVPIIDFSDELARAVDPLEYFPFGWRGHYNEKGYRLLAAFIQRRLSLGHAQGKAQ